MERLLYEEEGNALDFKREQYAFIGATDSQKGELLKDILAFANSWRRTDAYILVGVEEVKGGKSRVVGISSDLDDADVQQFINSKTQRALDFWYKTASIEGCKVGVFCILRQQRPFYPTRDYGSLKRDTVYVRRGSSTAIASPEEVARMGADVPSTRERDVCLCLQFASDENCDLLGREIAISTVDLQIIGGAIPDYGAPRRAQLPAWNVPAFDTWKNKDYYREYVEYARKTLSASGLRLAVTNTGRATANDVKVVLNVADDNAQLILFDSEHVPREPSNSSILMSSTYEFARHGNGPDLVAQPVPAGWQVTARISKVQPKDTVLTESLVYVGAKTTRQITFDAMVYCDEFEAPTSETLGIAVDVQQRTSTVADIIKNLG